MTNLVFMFANWYSGATLLAILLNNHPRLVCNGETFPFAYDKNQREKYICSCGEHMRNCKFYSFASPSLKNSDGTWNEMFRVLPQMDGSRIGNKIVGSFTVFPRVRNLLLSRKMPLRKELDTYLAAHEQFYAKARSYFGADCYIDGTKSIRRAELFHLYGCQPIKVVYLVRDPRGFCYSYLKNRSLPKKKLPEAVNAWREHLELVDIFKKRYPYIGIITICYEDLCLEPEKTLAKICQFLGVEYSPLMVGVPGEHHMLGNRMRSSFDGTVKLDLSWKEHFTVNELNIISGNIAGQMKRFGY